MADLFIDEESNKPFIRLDHTEMYRGLYLSAWHSIGSSLSTLCKMDARDSLTPMEDAVATYVTVRVELNKLTEHLEDCPDNIKAYPENKALADITAKYRELAEEFDFNHDRLDSVDHPRVLLFVRATMFWVDKIWECMEQKNGRKARAVARSFIATLENLRKQYDVEEEGAAQAPA